MIQFLRNTHCECGNPKPLDDVQQDFWDNHPVGGFLVHMLSLEEPMTLAKIMGDMHDYAHQHGERVVDVLEVCHGLIVGCELNLIRSVTVAKLTE